MSSAHACPRLQARCTQSESVLCQPRQTKQVTLKPGDCHSEAWRSPPGNTAPPPVCFLLPLLRTDTRLSGPQRKGPSKCFMTSESSRCDGSSFHFSAQQLGNVGRYVDVQCISVYVIKTHPQQQQQHRLKRRVELKHFQSTSLLYGR